MAVKKLSREEMAKRDIGVTAITPAAALLLSLVFLATILLVPIAQQLHDRRGGAVVSYQLGAVGKDENQGLFATIDRYNNAILEGINRLESDIEEGSFLRHLFLPPLQYAYLRFFDKGNEKAVPGRGGELHFASDLDALIGPPFLHTQQLRERRAGNKLWEKPVSPDPLPAILEFKKQLAERGIILVLMPVPTKAAVEPTTLSTRSVAAPLANRSFPALLSILAEKDILVFDPRPALSRYAGEHGGAYLHRDTHWLPGAMQAVAGALAAFVEQKVPELTLTAKTLAEEELVVGVGDIARMLTLPEGTDLYAPQEVRVRRIVSDRQELWLPERGAEILLLGDSFTNIYASEGLGWQTGAGLAEQLSHQLQRPIDLLARNDSAAYVTREMLAGELARGRDRLAGKKVVIWQFAERELSFGDWKLVSLTLGQPAAGGFYVAPAGARVKVSATIGAISRAARPGTVPYRDAVLTLHLHDLQGEAGKAVADQALVYGWGMRDNVLSRLAGLRPGDHVTFMLRPWDEVDGEYGSYRRTPLDDDLLELELPNWGEMIDEKNE
jgi:SGNH hydrolase-like domain, acetyltransferase AlgX